MLTGHDLLERDPVAFLERRNRREAVERLGVLGLVRVAVERVVPVEQDAGAGGSEQEPAVGQVEVDLRRLVDRGRHLRRQEPPPNQLIELEEIPLEVLLDVVRLETDFGGPNRFVRILDLRSPPAFMDVRLFGQVALVELRVDVLACLLDRGVRDADGIGSHVGNETDRSLIPKLHTLIQLLRRAHRPPGGKAQLFRRFLLHRAGRERGRRLAAAFSPLHRSHDERELLNFGDDVARRLLGFDLGLVPAELLEPRLKRLPVLLEIGGDRPVLLRHKLPDLLLALDDQTQGDRLHATRRQAGLDALPEHRRRLVADQAIQDPPGLLGVDLALVDVERIRQGLRDGIFRDFMEQDAADFSISI